MNCKAFKYEMNDLLIIVNYYFNNSTKLEIASADNVMPWDAMCTLTA